MGKRRRRKGKRKREREEETSSDEYYDSRSVWSYEEGDGRDDEDEEQEQEEEQEEGYHVDLLRAEGFRRRPCKRHCAGFPWQSISHTIFLARDKYKLVQSQGNNKQRRHFLRVDSAYKVVDRKNLPPLKEEFVPTPKAQPEPQKKWSLSPTYAVFFRRLISATCYLHEIGYSYGSLDVNDVFVAESGRQLYLAAPCLVQLPQEKNAILERKKHDFKLIHQLVFNMTDVVESVYSLTEFIKELILYDGTHRSALYLKSHYAIMPPTKRIDLYRDFSSSLDFLGVGRKKKWRKCVGRLRSDRNPVWLMNHKFFSDSFLFMVFLKMFDKEEARLRLVKPEVTDQEVHRALGAPIHLIRLLRNAVTHLGESSNNGQRFTSTQLHLIIEHKYESVATDLQKYMFLENILHVVRPEDFSEIMDIE